MYSTTTMDSSNDDEFFEVSYSRKDLILYALSLGMGSHRDDSNELKFLYENHDAFTAVDTFALVLIYLATPKVTADAKTIGAAGNTNTNDAMIIDIPSFPPPMMSLGVIPNQFLRPRNSNNNNDNNVDLVSNLPLIHTWQSIVWHQPLEVPTSPSIFSSSSAAAATTTTTRRIRKSMNIRTISVQPKSIGTFVTSQCEVYNTKPTAAGAGVGELCCTIQFTTLVLGIKPENVIAYDAGIERLTQKRMSNNGSMNSRMAEEVKRRPPSIFQWMYQTNPNTALLYRIGSGDSNHIHVDTSASSALLLGGEKRRNGTSKKKKLLKATTATTTRPLLHGLFTLALSFRAITKFITTTYDTNNNDIHNDGSSSTKKWKEQKMMTAKLKLEFQKLEGKFKHPAFVGDRLCVKLWKQQQQQTETKNQTVTNSSSNNITKTEATPTTTKLFHFLFEIMNPITGKVVVDCGHAQVEVSSSSVSEGSASASALGGSVSDPIQITSKL